MGDRDAPPWAHAWREDAARAVGARGTACDCAATTTLTQGPAPWLAPMYAGARWRWCGLTTGQTRGVAATAAAHVLRAEDDDASVMFLGWAGDFPGPRPCPRRCAELHRWGACLRRGDAWTKLVAHLECGRRRLGDGAAGAGAAE